MATVAEVTPVLATAPVAVATATPVAGAAPAGVMQAQGLTVATAMPTAPPLASLTDTWTGTTHVEGKTVEAVQPGAPRIERESDHPVAMGAPQTAKFYSPAELQKLQATVPPPDFQMASKGEGLEGVIPVAQAYAIPAEGGAPVAVATAVPAAEATPIVTTAAGFPIYPSNVRSQAETQYDGSKGVKSCDERLQQSIPELMSFLNTHNSRPRVGAEVHGWHYETRTRIVQDRDEEGNVVGSHPETSVVPVTDFLYTLDLTEFVYPYGYIQSVDENGLDINELCQKYIDDENKLKSLALIKEIMFDFRALERMIHGYIRSLGWWRLLDVSFPRRNYSVRVYSENWMSNMWENCLCCCLMHATIIPCLLMRCYRDCGDHKEEDIQSVFKIDYAPLQVFEMIRRRLHVPGFAMFDQHMDMYRGCFW